MALGTVIVTALGCLMFLDKNHVLSPGGVSAIAILLVILNIAFLQQGCFALGEGCL
jgi:hypothetical protein